MSEIDTQIITALTRHLDELVGECLGPDGKPIAPSYGALMRARGALPPTAKFAFTPR